MTKLFNLALQKVIQSINTVPSGIMIGKEQLNALAYADDIVLIRKKWNRNKTTIWRNRKHCQKIRTTYKPRKTKYDSGIEKVLN